MNFDPAPGDTVRINKDKLSRLLKVQCGMETRGVVIGSNNGGLRNLYDVKLRHTTVRLTVDQMTVIKRKGE